MSLNTLLKLFKGLMVISFPKARQINLHLLLLVLESITFKLAEQNHKSYLQKNHEDLMLFFNSLAREIF